MHRGHLDDQRRRGDPVSERVALVTGAAGGLGRALVATLGAEGWAVVGATHRSGEWSADLGDREAADRLVARTLDRRGRLDLLVANHAYMSLAPVEQHDPADWWHIVEVNLGGSFRLARAAAPHLRANGGSIVFVSSEWGIGGWPLATAYSASKAGLIGLTKALALELAPDIRVNAVAPGVIDTPQLGVDAAAARVTIDQIRRRYAEAAPLRRIGTAAEIARTVLFLAGPGGSYYTGQVLSPNGGTTLA